MRYNNYNRTWRVHFLWLDRENGEIYNFFSTGIQTELDGGIMRKEEFFSAKRVTGMAVLLALVVVLQLIGGYLKIGATSFSFVLVPIVLGGILYGVIVGGILGFVFGFMTLMAGITGTDAFTATLFQTQPVATALLCLGKATFAGIGSALLYQWIAKKQDYVAVFVAGAAAPVINTGLFVLGSICFFQDTLNANFVAEGSNVFYFLIIVCAGINFLVELTINLVASPAVYRVIRVVGGKKKGKNV